MVPQYDPKRGMWEHGDSIAVGGFGEAENKGVAFGALATTQSLFRRGPHNDLYALGRL